MFKRLYVPVSSLIILIAIVGFWRTYFGLMFTGKVDTTALIHFHVALQIGWLGLFTMQAVFAATGRLKIHIRLGPWLMIYGVILIIVGFILAFERFGTRLAENNIISAQRRLFSPLRDLVFFAPFLAAGWIWRKEPEMHKRLMLIATTILLLPAVARMIFLGRPVPEWKFMIVWPIPVYVAMIHDFVSKKIIHPVYVIGVVTMLIMRLCLPLRDTEAWMKVSGWIATFY